jgi:hypothetical protein
MEAQVEAETIIFLFVVCSCFLVGFLLVIFRSEKGKIFSFVSGNQSVSKLTVNVIK